MNGILGAQAQRRHHLERQEAEGRVGPVLSSQLSLNRTNWGSLPRSVFTKSQASPAWLCFSNIYHFPGLTQNQASTHLQPLEHNSHPDLSNTLSFWSFVGIGSSLIPSSSNNFILLDFTPLLLNLLTLHLTIYLFNTFYTI